MTKMGAVVQAYFRTAEGTVSKIPRNFLVKRLNKNSIAGIEFWFNKDARGCEYSKHATELIKIKMQRQGRAPIAGKSRKQQPPGTFVT